MRFSVPVILIKISYKLQKPKKEASDYLFTQLIIPGVNYLEHYKHTVTYCLKNSI